MQGRARLLTLSIVFPTFFLALLLIVHVGYLMVWPPHSVSGVKMEVLTEEVDQGGTVFFRSSLCKHVETATELHFGLRSIDSSHYFDAGMEYGNNPRRCFTIIQHFHIPSDVPPGKYRAWVVAVMEVNSIRTDRFRFLVGDVTVAERDQ